MPEEQVSIVAILRDRVSPAVPKVVSGLNAIKSTVLGISRSFAGLGLALGAGAIIQKSLAEARQRAIAEGRTLTALSGQVAVLQRIKNEISKIPKIPGLDEDVLIDQAAAMLNLGIASDRVTESLRAAVSVSSALGVSLDASLELVKAIETGGESRLIKRIPQLRKLREEGRLAADGIATLNKLFSAQAEGAANNVFAQTDAAAERLNDALSDLGDTLAPLKRDVVDFLADSAEGLVGAGRLIRGAAFDEKDRQRASEEARIKRVASAIGTVDQLSDAVESLNEQIDRNREIGGIIDLSRDIQNLRPQDLRAAIAKLDPEIRGPITDIFSSQIQRAVETNVIGATRALDLQRSLELGALQDELSLLDDQAAKLRESADAAGELADQIFEAATLNKDILLSGPLLARELEKQSEQLQKQKDALNALNRLEERRVDINLQLFEARARLVEFEKKLLSQVEDGAKSQREALDQQLKDIEALAKTGAISAGEAILKQRQAIDSFNRKLDETVVLLKSMENSSVDTAGGIDQMVAKVNELRDGVKLMTEESDDFFAGFLEGMRQGASSLDTLRETGIEVGRTLSESLADGVVDIFVRGRKTVREWASELLFSIAEILIKFAVMRALSKGLEGTSFGSFLGFGTGTQEQAQQGGNGGGGGGGGVTGSTSVSTGVVNITASTVNVGGGTGGVPGTTTTGQDGGIFSSILDVLGGGLGFLRGTGGEIISGGGSLLNLLGGGLTSLGGLAAGSTDPLTQLLGGLLGGGGGLLSGGGSLLTSLGGLVGGGNTGAFSSIASLIGPLLGGLGGGGALGGATSLLGPLLSGGGLAALGTGAAPFTGGLSLLLPLLGPLLEPLLGGLLGGGGGGGLGGIMSLLTGLLGGGGGLGGLFGSLSSFLPLLFLHDGGLIPGPVSSRDNTLIGARTGEYVLTPEAVSHAGLDYIHAVNKMAIPRHVMRAGFAGGAAVPVRHSLASGGLVGGGRGGRGGMPVGAVIEADEQTMERLLHRGRRALQREFEQYGADYRRHLGTDRKK